MEIPEDHNVGESIGISISENSHKALYEQRLVTD